MFVTEMLNKFTNVVTIMLTIIILNKELKHIDLRHSI